MDALSPFSALYKIKDSLPIKETVVYPKESKFKYDCAPLKEGVRVVRPVVLFNTGRKLILSPAFKRNDRKALVVKAVIPSTTKKFFTNNPIATNDKNGLICFCNAEIPENWIYFTIEKVSEKKNYAIVSFKKGTDDELFALYNFPK